MDMWAVGVLTYLLLSGRPLVSDKSANEVRNIIKKGDYTLSLSSMIQVSKEGKDFLSKLLC